ncbi:MAG: TIGR02453 family protein [Kiloniellales bacterium]
MSKQSARNAPGRSTAEVAFSDAGLVLLDDLAKNNNREWYKAHKDAFEALLLAPFAATLEAISDRLAAEGMTFRGGKNTMFRMNRDVRFSKDKSPYKINVSGVLTPNGDKREGEGFVYLHLEAKTGFAAFGRYNLSPKALGPVRDRILEKPDRFGKILGGLKAEGLDLFRSMSLSSMPRGYSDHADHRFAAELKLKSMMVRLDLPQSAWESGEVVDRVAHHALVCRDFIEFVSV